ARPQHLRDMQADRPQPEDERGLACPRSRPADAMDGDGERLDRRAVLERELCRQRMDVDADRRFRDPHALREGALDAEADAALVHVLAEMAEPLAAAATLAARLDGDAGDAVADRDPAHLAADLDHLAGELVPEDLARLDQRALEICMQVGAADPACPDLENEVGSACNRLGCVLDRDRAEAAVDADEHAASLPRACKSRLGSSAACSPFRSWDRSSGSRPRTCASAPSPGAS